MSTFSIDQLIGKTEEDAKKEAAKVGMSVRIRTKGDRVTGEHNQFRINLYIENSKVVKAHVG